MGAGGLFKFDVKQTCPPTDIHSVSRNASKTQPAKFVVFLVAEKGAPRTVPVK